MVQMLVAGKAEHDTRSKENAMIEFNETADMDFIPSPRVLNSHLFLRQLSSEIVEKRSRVVHVIRNPKDLVVSFYFHMKQLRMFQDNGFEDFALKFLNSTDFQGNNKNNSFYTAPQQQLYELFALYKSTNVMFQNTHQYVT